MSSLSPRQIPYPHKALDWIFSEYQQTCVQNRQGGRLRWLLRHRKHDCEPCSLNFLYPWRLVCSCPRKGNKAKKLRCAHIFKRRLRFLILIISPARGNYGTFCNLRYRCSYRQKDKSVLRLHKDHQDKYRKSRSYIVCDGMGRFSRGSHTIWIISIPLSFPNGTGISIKLELYIKL